MLNNRELLKLESIEEEIQKHLQLNPQEVNISFSAQYIDPIKIKKYLDINIPTAIQSVMGTGKTKYVIEIIKQAKEQNLSVLYIAPNISTIEDTQEQLKAAQIQSITHKEVNYFDSY